MSYVDHRIIGINKRGESFVTFISARHTLSVVDIKALYKRNHPKGWRKLPKHVMTVERMNQTTREYEVLAV
jgi:hypothetical protein